MLSSWTKNETLISCCLTNDHELLFQRPSSDVTLMLWCHSCEMWRIHFHFFKLFQLHKSQEIKVSWSTQTAFDCPFFHSPCTINLKREFHVYYIFVNQCYWASKFLKWWCCSLSQKKLLEFLNAMFARKLLLSKKDCHCHVWNGWFCGSHKVLCRHGLLTKTKTQQTAVQVLLPSEPAPANPFGVLCSHSKVQ